MLMHGRGADEHDLAPFLDILDPERRLVGVTPGGPCSCAGGRHWYVVPRVGYPDPDSFRASYDLLQRDIPELTGVPWKRRSSAASRRARSWPTPSGSAPGAPPRPGSSP